MLKNIIPFDYGENFFANYVFLLTYIDGRYIIYVDNLYIGGNVQ